MSICRLKTTAYLLPKHKRIKTRDRLKKKQISNPINLGAKKDCSTEKKKRHDNNVNKTRILRQSI